MTDEPATDARRARPVLKACVAIAVVLLIGLGGYIYQGHRGLAKLRERLTAQGEQLDWRKIGTNAAPHQVNGMPDLLAAAGDLPELNLSSRSPFYGSTSPGRRCDVTQIDVLPAEFRRWTGTSFRDYWVSNMWSELEPKINGYRHIWQQAVDATTNEVMLHQLDWPQGYKLGMHPSMHLRPLWRWSRAAIAYDLHQGSIDDALATTTNALRIVAMSEGVPTMLSEMVRQAGTDVLHLPVWWLLQRRLSDPQLANLQDSIAKLRFAEPGQRALQTERALVIQTWESLLADPGAGFMGIGGPGYSFRALVGGLGLRLWSLGPAHHDLGWHLQNFQVEINTYRESVGRKSVSVEWPPTNRPSRIYIFSTEFETLCKGFRRIVFRRETVREIQVSAVALHRYRLGHGTFPEALRDLVPELLPAVPVDWMDGQPLRYQRSTPNEFSLWSVGEDGIDHGGDPTPVRTYGWLGGRDIVWPVAAGAAETKKFKDDAGLNWKKATPPGKP